MDNYKNKFGQFLLNRRKQLGVMQKDIADNLGVTTQAIYKYEKGISYPDLPLVGLYAELLKTDLDSFFHLKETYNNPQSYKFDIEKFSTKLKQLRKSNNLTLVDLSLKINVKFQTISKWEQSKSLPTIPQFINLANYYNISFTELYYGLDKHIQINPDETIQIKTNKKAIVLPAVFMSLIIVFLVVILIFAIRPKYYVTFDYGGLLESTHIKVGKNQKVDYQDVRVDGYQLVGYTLDDAPYDFNNAISKDITLKAVFEPLSYTISLDANGGICDSESLIISFNESVSLPTCSLFEHQFVGWSYNNQLISSDFIYKYLSDITLEAIYAANEYYIHFDADGGNAIDDQKVCYNETYSLPVPVKNGYIFYGWLLGDAIVSNKSTYLYTNDLYLKALWNPLFTIDFDSDGGNTIDTYIGTSLDVKSLPIPYKEGYRFEGWKYQDSIISTPFHYDFDDNIVLVACWTDLAVEYYYKINENNEIEITDYIGDSQNVIIPSTICGIRVTSIKSSVFKNKSNIKSVSFPTTIIEYEDGCLKCLNNLETLSIPDNISTTIKQLFDISSSNELPESFKTIEYSLSKEGTINYDKNFYNGINKKFAFILPSDLAIIDKQTFKNVLIIDTLIIKEGCKRINDSAFEGCEYIKKIYLPKSVEHIGANCFYKCDILDSLYYDGSIDDFINKHSILNGGYLFDKLFLKNHENGYELVENVVIPDNVISIPDYAFCGCTGIKNIVLHDKITSIGKYAFYKCKSLENIDFPSSISDIGESAFMQCESIKQVTIPELVNRIHRFAFAECLSIEEVNFHNGIKYIEDYAFGNCHSLKVLDLPDNLLSIGNMCFTGIGIDSLIIPEGVEIIEEDSFTLTEIKYLFISGCKIINKNAFKMNYQLETVILPESIEIIKEEAFGLCTNLQCIYYLGSEEQWNQVVVQDSSFTDFKIYYYSETDLGTNDFYWHFVDNKPVIW